MATEPPARAKPKGLWKLMQAAPAALADSPDAAASPSPLNAPILPSPPGRGAGGEGGDQPTSPQPIPEAEGKHDVAAPLASQDEIAALIGIPADEPLASARQRSARRGAGSALRGRLALALGLLSIPLSALAVIQAPWGRMPALGAGFAAIVLGLVALGDSERDANSRIRKRLALAGLAAGMIGMFLGPIVIAPRSPDAQKAGIADSAPDDEENPESSLSEE